MTALGLKAGLLLRLRIVSQPVRHVIYKLAEILGGWAFLSRPGQALWRMSLAARAISPPPGIRAAMIAHIYYPELLDEVLASWRALPDGAPLHLTVTAERADELRARLGARAGVVVHETPNRGRDIAPFLAVLASGALDGYQAVLKLHTKRSPHLWTGELRRRLLFVLHSGEAAQVRRILNGFANPHVGLAGWRWMLRTRASYWNANEGTVRGLMGRMAPDAPVDLAFFEGSMFWFRPAALEPLRRLGLTSADFEEEAGQTDGALQHAVERCFGLAARAAGYWTTDLSGRRVLTPPPVESATADRFEASPYPSAGS